jgi:hypothetical protein
MCAAGQPSSCGASMCRTAGEGDQIKRCFIQFLLKQVDLLDSSIRCGHAVHGFEANFDRDFLQHNPT